MIRRVHLAMALACGLAMLACSSEDDDPPPGAGGAGGGVVVEPGTVIAQLQVELPSFTPLVLRGTVPLPAGISPQDDGRVPLVVENADGEPLATQVDGVTRFPDGSHQVVEVSARVDAPASGRQGDRVGYAVMFSPFQGPAAPTGSTPRELLAAQGELGADARAMLTGAETVLLVGVDADGNRYEVDLLAGSGWQQLLAAGAVQTAVATYGTMELAQAATSPPSGCSPYPHLFGAHGYFEVYAGEDVVRLDLRFHNGFSGRDDSTPNDDNLGEVAYRSLELHVPSGWTVVQQNPDPFFDNSGTAAGPYTVVQLVAALPDPQVHWLPRKYQVERRLMLVRDDATPHATELLDEAGLGFAVAGENDDGEPLFSWENAATAAYLPPSHRVPSLAHADLDAVRADHAADLGSPSTEGSVRWIFATGNPSPSGWPYQYGVLGAVHPKSAQYGGVTGGEGIEFMPGVDVVGSASRAGFLLTQLEHRGYGDRHRTAYYNADGRPTTPSEWVENGDEIPFTFSQSPLANFDPFGYENVDSCLADYVTTAGIAAPYKDDIEGFASIDLQHLIRYTKTAKALAWLGNDWMARDDLRREAEVAHLSLHEYWFRSNEEAWFSLRSRWVDVTAEPGVGFGTGRGQGWSIDVINAYYRVADDAWRAEIRPWYDLLVDVYELGQADCPSYGGGFFGRSINTKFEPFQEAYWGVQPWEDMIVANALHGALASVYAGEDPDRTARLRTLVERLKNAVVSPMSWSHHRTAPFHLAVAYRDPIRLICTLADQPADGVGNGEGFYVPHLLGAGHTLLDDAALLDRAAEMMGVSTPAECLAELQTEEPQGLSNRATLLAALQLALAEP